MNNWHRILQHVRTQLLSDRIVWLANRDWWARHSGELGEAPVDATSTSDLDAARARYTEDDKDALAERPWHRPWYRKRVHRKAHKKH